MGYDERVSTYHDVTMDGDQLFIGDICYALDDHIYYDVWGSEMKWEDGIIKDKDKVCSVVVSTQYGDGCYCDNQGNGFGVDAGNIGVTSSYYWDKDKIVDGGLIIDIPSKVASVNVEYDDGFITIAIYDFISNTLLYRDTIDTRWEEEEE